MSLFAVTRGQFSMIDAILHTLDQVGPAKVSAWTWTIADYEVQCFERLLMDARITAGLLVIDHGARGKNLPLLQQWADTFGPGSIRLVVNHAKIATVEAEDGRRVLLRGSMNLNRNPRFEQLDVTEGGPDFELVRKIEAELEVLPMTASGHEVCVNTRILNAFEPQSLQLFKGLRVWAK
jgi:hypothetical protein